MIRDGRLLPRDKDVDIALPWTVPRAPLIQALEAYGFECPARADGDGGARPVDRPSSGLAAPAWD